MLNARQVRWAELFSQYRFDITYRPGSENAAADALSRKTEDLRTQKDKKDAARFMQLFRPVLEDSPREAIQVSVVDVSALELTADTVTLLDDVLRLNRSSAELDVYRQKVAEGVEGWTGLNGLSLNQGRLVVPDVDDLRTRIIHAAHATVTAAHPGRQKTRQLVNSQYWWPGMYGDIERFVANCLLCRASKVPRDKTPGKLHPLPVPDRVWQHLVMDFKSMPKDKQGYDNALVIVDRFSKAAWTIPCTREATAKDAAQMYYNGPFRVHGYPDSVVTDRGPQFISDFTDEFSRLTGQV